MTTLTLAEIQPFIDFVNGNLSLKPYTLQSLSTWASSAGKPLVASGNGYGVVLGDFPATGVTAINGRSGAVTLDSTDVGLGNVPNVNCTDASNITSGTLPLSVIPAAALERLVHVADEAARFALTIAEVQNGDTVMQDDTQIMYRVVDDTHLGDASGYQEYKAGLAAQVHWSGVLDVPQNLVDIGAITAAERDMLVYSGGRWVSMQPLDVRANLDLPVKGDWNMSPITLHNDILQYPVMDGVAEFAGGAPFPTVSPDDSVHSFSINEGTLPWSSLIAGTAGGIDVALNTASIGDLPLPTDTGPTPILVELSSDVSANFLPGDNPQALFGVYGIARDASLTKSLMIIAQVTLSSSDPVLAIQILANTGAGPVGLVAQMVPLAYPIATRIVFYFNGDGTFGYVLDGVDQGLVGGGTPFVLPTYFTDISLLKIATFASIAVGEPQAGKTASIRHSIDLGQITESLPGMVPWYTLAVYDPDPPVGVEIGNRFYARPGGSYLGVTAETGDIVEFVTPTNIFVYPKASSLVRLSQYNLDVGNLTTTFNNYMSATDTHLTTLDNQVSGLQTTVGDHETRITTLEGEMALAYIPSELQKIILDSPLGYLRGNLAHDLPGGGFAGVDVLIASYPLTGSFVGVVAGQLIVPTGTPHGSSWIAVDPPIGLRVAVDNAGPQAAAGQGNCLQAIYWGSDYRTGLEITDVPGNWVCASLFPDTSLGSPSWVVNNDARVVNLYPGKNRAIDVAIADPFSGGVVTFHVVDRYFAVLNGEVLVRNTSSAEAQVMFTVASGGGAAVTITNENRGDTSNYPLTVGYIPAGGTRKFHWSLDAQSAAAPTFYGVRLSVRMEEVKLSPAVVALAATVMSATQAIPDGAEVVSLSADPNVSSQTLRLPRAVEGRRIIFRATSPLQVTLTALSPDIVYSSCATFTVQPGSLTEIVYRASMWYLASKASAPLSSDMVLKVNTDPGPSLSLLTVNGTLNANPANLPATSPPPNDVIRQTAATHHVVVHATGNSSYPPGVLYYKEFIIHTAAYYQGGTPAYVEVAETVLSEQRVGWSDAGIWVEVDASNVDGLLRIYVGTATGDAFCKAAVTTKWIVGGA